MMDEIPKALSLLAAFSMLSVLAVGGGSAVLPEMHKIVVLQHEWLGAQQFKEIYSLGQVAPGPNMTMVAVIGESVAGPFGWLAAVLGFFLPSSLLALAVNRFWHRLESWQWRESIEAGLAPLAIGLMASGAWLLAKLAVEGRVGLLVATFTTGILILYKINPFWLILAGVAAGLLGAF